MNNMLEYMTGGQCYKCGGKVRYADGGEADPSAVADMSGMQMGQQPQKQGPSVLEANADQLLKFLKQQLEKGTSSRILKKTLLDSGLKAEEADSILMIAQEEFDKDFSDNQDQMAQQQAAMSQNQMMQPSGQQPAVNAGDDQSVMAMNNQGQQSQMTDEQMMMQQGRYGGSMRKLSRMNMGGTCPEGFMWDDMSGSCRPSAVTANLMTQGAGPVNTAQQTTKNNGSQPNYNAMQDAHAANVNAQSNMYTNMLDSYNQKKVDAKNVTQQFVGNAYTNVRNGQTPFQALGLAPPPQPAVTPQPLGRFGGLHKFVMGGDPGECPDGTYWNGSACVPVFGSNAPKATNVDLASSSNGVPVKGLDPSTSPIFGSNENAVMGTHWSNNKQQVSMAEAEAPAYVRENADNTVNQQNAYNMTGDRTAFDARPMASNTNDPNAPVDPRTSNSPYITYTDKNKIANLDANWVNKSLAVANLMGDPRTGAALLPSEGFGSGLKFLMGAAAFAGGAGLGLGKFMGKDKTRTYDDKGNVFYGDPAKQSKDPSAPVETGRNADIGKDQMLQTNTDEYGQPMGIDRSGALVSQGNPQRNEMRNVGTPAEQRYTDNVRLDEALWVNDKTKKDFREQGPALFGDSKYGSQDELSQQYADRGMFGKMQMRNQFKKDDLWDVPQNNSASMPTQEEGGEYNPFLDKRPRFMVNRPVYSLGGETTPYDFAKWAQMTGNNPADINNPSVKSSYDAYVQSFGPAANNQNANGNANNALSANPNAGMVNTKEYTTSTGDPLGFQVASNMYNGAVMMNDAAAGWAQEKKMDDLKVRNRRLGNSMENAVAINPVNPYGSMYAPNAGPGANQALATQGYTFDLGTTMATSKYGGTKDYKKGGTYFLSQQDIDRIIAMGGEVEFLD